MADSSTEIHEAVALFANRQLADCPLDLPISDIITDSFQYVEFALDMEDRFQVTFSDTDLPSLKTVGDVISYIVAASGGTAA